MRRVKCAFLLAVISLLELRSAGQDNPSRQITAMPGVSIAENLRPEDAFVVVQRGDEISSFVDERELDFQSDLDERVQFADAIAVVQPKDTRSYLTSNGGWIQSSLQVHLVKALKDTIPPIFGADGLTSIEHDGGELFIGHVRVRAGRHFLLKQGERYLVFLKARSRSRVFFIGTQFKITAENKIAPIDLSDGRVASVSSSFYGVPLKRIADEVQLRLRP